PCSPFSPTLARGGADRPPAPEASSGRPATPGAAPVSTPLFAPEVKIMSTPRDDVPFVRRSGFEGVVSGLGSIGEARALPPMAPKESARTESQKARANDLFLRGALTPEQLAQAKADRAGFEAIIGQSNFLPAVFLEIGAASSRSTCLIRTSGVDFTGRSG